ncbi:MAG TPA: histidine kinase [Bacteroidota bacterium]|nr:histidine kinase [Bacteroidota bacterium]
MDGEVHSPAGGFMKPNITLEDGGHPQIMTDADQKIVDVNDRFLFLSGYGRGELRGILLTDLLHSEDRDKFAEHWHLLAQTGTSAVAARLRTKSEFTLHARFQSELVKPGEFRTTMIGTAGEHYPAAELGRKNRFALALYEIGRQMTSSFDVEEVLKLVVKNTAWLLESHFVAVALLDSKTSRIEYREKIGDRTDVTPSVAAGKDRGLAGRVIASQAPFIIEKFPERPFVQPKEFPLVEAESLVSAFGVPITNKERKFGALVVGYRNFREIPEEDVQLVSNLANQTALALENAMLYQESVKYSKTMAALSSRLTMIQEEERRRITRELHDGIGQALTGLRFNLDALVRQASITDPDAVEQVAVMKQVIDESLNTIRQIAFDLRPPILDDLGLVSALRIYLDRFQERTKILLTLSCPDDLKRFDPKVEATIYRIIQEALTNVAKHSGAKNAKVEIEKPEATLHVMISDDGKGFDQNAAGESGLWPTGLGIVNMRDRVEGLRGKFRLASEKGKGTSIHIEVPLNGR